MAKDVKDMEDVTELDLMNEFMQISTKPLRENELTVNDLMSHMNITRNRARYTLSKYEQAGLLKSRKVIIDSSSVCAYSPVSGSWRDVVEAIKQEE